MNVWIPRQPAALPGPQVEGRESLFIIHFWSPAEPDTRAALGRLAQLHRRFASRRVSIIAVTNDDAEPVAALAHRLELPFTLATDDDNNTSEAWLGDEPAFPYSFLVDAGGRVIWMGSSTAELAQLVGEALDGAYNLAAARQRAAAEQKISEITGTLEGVQAAGDLRAALRVADRIIAVDPTRIESYTFKRSLAVQYGRPADVAAADEAMRAALWGSAAGLEALLDAQWSERSIARRDPALRLRCARRLVDLTRRQDPFALHELARVEHEVGHVSEAVRAMERACELIAVDAEGEFKERLEYLRKVHSAGATLVPASRPADAPATRPAASAPAADGA